jgi:hypothetical protein
MDPLTGRWLSRDPIRENGGINLSAFAENDGVTGVDYLGLQDLGDSLHDNLVKPPDPYEHQNQLDTQDAASVDAWESAAKNDINSKINCTSKPNSVDGYSGVGGSQIQAISRVALNTEANVSVIWDNTTCCWAWSATLTASNDWGASRHAEFGKDVGESVEWLLWPFFPAIHLPVGKWDISDDGCCNESAFGSP